VSIVSFNIEHSICATNVYVQETEENNLSKLWDNTKYLRYSGPGIYRYYQMLLTIADQHIIISHEMIKFFNDLDTDRPSTVTVASITFNFVGFHSIRLGRILVACSYNKFDCIYSSMCQPGMLWGKFVHL